VSQKLATADGVIDPVKIYLSPGLIAVPNLATLRQTVRVHIGDAKTFLEAWSLHR